MKRHEQVRLGLMGGLHVDLAEETDAGRWQYLRTFLYARLIDQLRHLNCWFR